METTKDHLIGLPLDIGIRRQPSETDSKKICHIVLGPTQRRAADTDDSTQVPLYHS